MLSHFAWFSRFLKPSTSNCVRPSFPYLTACLSYRPIFPRSLSDAPNDGGMTFRPEFNETCVDLSFRPTLRADLMVHQKNLKNDQLFSRKSQFKSLDHTSYFFTKFGSCFNQLQTPLTYTSNKGSNDNVSFDSKQFKEMFSITQFLLKKEFLEIMNSMADHVFQSGPSKPFPYKSLSEVTSLIMISMIRELVLHVKPGSFVQNNL